jgi:hypothetical protein
MLRHLNESTANNPPTRPMPEAISTARNSNLKSTVEAVSRVFLIKGLGMAVLAVTTERNQPTDAFT